MFLTSLLLALFVCQYICQRQTIYRQIVITRRINRCEVSSADIVAMMTKRYHENDYCRIYLNRSDGWIMVSNRYYLSETGRLYQHQIINHKKSVRYVSRYNALIVLQQLTDRRGYGLGFQVDSVEHLTSPRAGLKLFQYRILRPCHI